MTSYEKAAEKDTGWGVTCEGFMHQTQERVVQIDGLPFKVLNDDQETDTHDPLPASALRGDNWFALDDASLAKVDWTPARKVKRRRP